MKITGSATFVLSEVIWKENSLVPVNFPENEKVLAEEFIGYYQSENFDRIALEQNGQDLRVTIALCTLGENESWEHVAKEQEVRGNGWSGASLTLWKLYVQNRKEALPETVILPGTLYLTDDMTQWVPLAHHRPIISLLGGVRGSETKVLMKPLAILSLATSMTIGRAKIHTVLISKKETVKT